MVPGSTVTLAQNTYDQAASGYYNIGLLTRSEHGGGNNYEMKQVRHEIREEIKDIWDTFTKRAPKEIRDNVLDAIDDPLAALEAVGNSIPNPASMSASSGLKLGALVLGSLRTESKVAEMAFKDFNQAQKAAMDWLSAKGFRAEKVNIGKFGKTAGKPNGMQTSDKLAGFRVEYDARHGAHINAWAGKEKATFTFSGTDSMVESINKRFER